MLKVDERDEIAWRRKCKTRGITIFDGVALKDDHLNEDGE